jgi:hypothetical protein
MIVVCRSPKGGSGTTITSAALAMMLAAQHRGGGYIVDLAGELAPALGIPDPPDTQPVDVNASLKLLSFAPRELRTPVEHNWKEVANQLLSYDAPVVIDVGTGELNESFERIANRTFLVLRPCYLALSKASNKMSHGYLRNDGIIVLEESGRALTPTDISTVLKTPIVSTIKVDPSVSRAVDAGLLSSRIPAALNEGLRALVEVLSIPVPKKAFL